MPGKNYFTSNVPEYLLVVALILFYSSAYAQSSTFIHRVNSGTEKWKPFLVKNRQDLQIPAPPEKEQTERELKEIKSKMMKQNEQSLQQILYWDAGSPAYRWNQLGSSLLSLQDFQTFSRTPTSWMNIAIYDASIAAWEIKNKYRRLRPEQMDATLKTVITSPASFSYPCEHTVTAAAAATVLAYFFPLKADSILKLAKKAAESRISAGVQFPSDVEAGWQLGLQLANLVIEEAKQDGSERPWSGKMNKDPKLWTGDYPVGATASDFKPLVLTAGNQFRPPAPPDFEKDMQELKTFRQDSRTEYLAHYWAAKTGYDVWTELANQKIFEYRVDKNTLACARIYALLNLALHEATIAIMDAKYAYWGIRPFQYDTSYRPLLFTPPFPGYPSGHAAASATACTILSYFFPADASQFESTARECAESRFYGGIHFRTDNESGLTLGKKVGTYIIENWESGNRKLAN